MEHFYKETDIEILISTMNRDSLDFLVPMFPFVHFSNFSILIINQTQKGKNLVSTYSNIRVINFLEKGLSKSRNLAIENAIGKILVIADDDVVYQEGFVNRLVNCYNTSPEAAVINFCAINSKGKRMKKYPLHSKNNLNYFDIFNTSSIEMTLNKKIIDDVKIRFDPNFGLGGVFEMGEEAVFLFELKRKKKQLIFEPQVIVQHEGLPSSAKKSIIEKYYILGAVLTIVFKNRCFFWLIVNLFFDVKQRKIRFSNLIIVLKSFYQGRRKIEVIQYKNEE